MHAHIHAHIHSQHTYSVFQVKKRKLVVAAEDHQRVRHQRFRLQKDSQALVDFNERQYPGRVEEKLPNGGMKVAYAGTFNGKQFDQVYKNGKEVRDYVIHRN